MIEMIKENATVIQAASALISALAVLISTWFIIWTSFFRKTRRDRIDELKEEMQVMLGGRAILTPSERSSFLQSLDSKFKIPKYGKLHSVAFAELEIENKVEVRWTPTPRK